MTKKQAINPLATRPGYQLRRASLKLTGALVRELEPLELTLTEASIIMILAAAPRQTQSALGRTLGIHRANMAPMVLRLEVRGLIDRVGVDGRSHGLVLTDEGNALSQSANVITAKVDAAFFEDDTDTMDLAKRLAALWNG